MSSSISLPVRVRTLKVDVLAGDDRLVQWRGKGTVETYLISMLNR
jgi:hypothetical protein